jgi:hypothetical protein
VCSALNVYVTPIIEKIRIFTIAKNLYIGDYNAVLWYQEVNNMCRSIKPLFNFNPPVSEDEIRAAALQFVRKVSGFTKPSKANEAVFNSAVEEITAISRKLLDSLETNAPPKNREEETTKAQARSVQRFPRSSQA